MCDFALAFHKFDEILKIIKIALKNGRKMNDEENGTQRRARLTAVSQKQPEENKRCPEYLIQLVALAEAEDEGLEV